MTSPSLAKENQERADIMKAEAALREKERASTMFDHARAAADDELGGRFARHQPQIVVGSSPVIYPKLPASSPWSGPDLVGDEPPLGYSIDDLEHPGLPLPVEAQAGPTPADAPSFGCLGDEQRSGVGPPSSNPRAGQPSSPKEGPNNGQ
jgi:hypothetical protein